MCFCTCQQLLWAELPCNMERSQGDPGEGWREMLGSGGPDILLRLFFSNISLCLQALSACEVGEGYPGPQGGETEER